MRNPWIARGLGALAYLGPLIMLISDVIDAYRPGNEDFLRDPHWETFAFRTVMLAAIISTLALPFAIANWGAWPAPRPWRCTAELAVTILPIFLGAAIIGALYLMGFATGH